MKAAIISLTENGRLLSANIAEKSDFIEPERFCFHSHSDPSANEFINLSDLVSGIFTEYEALIFVCACGIAVRAVAPYLRSKTSDPAVVVIDDCGRYVIPILSGHIGGANALAKRLAELISAQPVITTATDIGGHFSPDSFAAANGLIIEDMNVAKTVAAAVLDGEPVGFVSDYEYRKLPAELSPDNDSRIGIYVGYRDIRPFPVTLKLIPKNIVLGIGCKRGTKCSVIEKAVLSVLSSADLPIERVRNIASIDLKSDEQGMLGFCRKHDIKPVFFSAEELKETAGDFTASDFVRSVTGVDNVCERSAVLCSGGKLVLGKTAFEGVTVAVAEMPVILDFERKIL
ncbi:MAG: cobalt-precorrin 5A hydrolase [Ruminococcus sp.]|nr:cobalt-precorrin 5A hydrolase [Ruminococcus sp.]